MSDPGPTVFNDRYELHRRLGRGGMAEVFLARDQLLDRPVAVKVLFPEFATDPAFVERFRREAQAAANLNHPNIVGVYDWGEEDGTYFIVMEYVEGRTLAEILRAEGPLHPDRAADIAADVAAALGFAHRNGVVHRDVKPGNVLVTASRAGEGGRLRHRPGDHGQRGRGPHPDRRGHGHRHLLLARAGPGRAGRPPLATSTRSAACSTRWSSVARPSRGDSPGGHRVQARAGVAHPAAPAQRRAAARPSRRSSSSAWPRTRSTATRRPRTCGPTSAASARATGSWPSR